MPKMQIVPKIKPTSCLCQEEVTVAVETLDVSIARMHKPSSEVLIK